MIKSKYSESRFVVILKQNQGSVSEPNSYREHGMSSVQFYNWRSKYRRMLTLMTKLMKE